MPDRGDLVGRAHQLAGEGGILLPGDEQCTGGLGEKIFAFALCSCTDVTMLVTFVTDSFDSNDPNMPVLAGGAVGVNRALHAVVVMRYEVVRVVAGDYPHRELLVAHSCPASGSSGSTSATRTTCEAARSAAAGR